MDCCRYVGRSQRRCSPSHSSLQEVTIAGTTATYDRERSAEEKARLATPEYRRTPKAIEAQQLRAFQFTLFFCFCNLGSNLGEGGVLGHVPQSNRRFERQKLELLRLAASAGVLPSL